MSQVLGVVTLPLFNGKSILIYHTGSDFYISDLVQLSDNEEDVSDTENRSYEKFSSENQVQDDTSSNGTQQIVNQTILDRI